MIYLLQMKYLLYIIILIGIIFACVFFVHTQKISDSSIIPIQIQTNIATSTTPIIPVALSIESINIHTTVESVGIIDNTNTMAVPKNPNNVGWYNLGARPGDIGSAVFAGHVNWIHGKNAVFTNLHKIKINDIVSVADDKNNTIYFIVRGIKTYVVNADTTDVFSSHDGLAHLNLVTCDGPWNPAIKTSERRLVVFTDKI